MNRAEISLVGKLVLAQARQRPGRIVLTIFATIAAACIVVWVVSGYDALVQKFDEFSGEYLGRYQLVVVPKSLQDATGFGRGTMLPLRPEVIASLRSDPTIAAIDTVFQTRIRVQVVFAAGTEAPKLKSDDMPTLVGTDASESPYQLVAGDWIDPGHADRMEVAISRGWAERLHVSLGDELIVSGAGAADGQRVRIIGIVEQLKPLPPLGPGKDMPSMRVTVLRRGPADAAVYAPIALAEKLAGRPAEISFAGVVLQQGASAAEFRSGFVQRHAAAAREVEIETIEEVGAELDHSATSKTARTQAYSATGISLLAALFIIFTTLSMGVHEQVRQLAVLRAVAITKAQVAAMIALESILLGVIGWIGGLIAGWGLLKIALAVRPDLFPGGASLGMWCIALAGVCALGGSLIASILPAWRATTVSPLEAMGPRPTATLNRYSRPIALAGLVLIGVNPLLVFFVPMPDAARYAVSAAIGCTSTAIGFVLIAPTIIVFAERILGPLVARCLGLNSRLLAMQLTANLGRTLGTSVALTLGLGLFVAMQTWGYSMLAPFMPGDWVPDLLVTIGPGGISPADIAAADRIQGIVPDQCLPLAVEQPKFTTDLTGALVRPSVTRQDNCILVGVDPQQAFGGTTPMLNCRFVEGTRAAALAKLQRGRYCLVPDHFQRESGLGVGGKISLIPPNSPDGAVEYEIAGVVSLPGWHLISKGGLRPRSGRSGAMVFAPYDEVRRDFAIERISFLAINLEQGASEEQIQTSLQAIIDHSAATNLPASNDGDRRPRPARIRVQSTAALSATIRKHADSIIWGLSKLPLITLAVAALGVVNTVLSSLRARRWELGVLRAVGVTQFGLVRLIVAEAILVGLVACLLSLGFGVVAGYCGTEVTRYADVHGGLITPPIIPWIKLAPGFAGTLCLCLLAAIGPAIATGRVEPLRLLQGGRAAV